MALSPCTSKAYQISPQGEELTRHGSALFPVAFYNDNLEKMNVAWHWHDEMEAVYIEQGKTVIYAGHEKYSLHEGQAVFINSNIMHAGKGAKGSKCRYHSLVFHPRLIGGSLDSIYWESYLQPLMKNGPKSLSFDGKEPWHEKAQNVIESACRKELRTSRGLNSVSEAPCLN